MSNQNTSEIKFLVELDDNRVPEKLMWSAKDGGVDQEEAKAIMLSIWDSKVKETMRIDLWTKDMPVDEMKIFFHQTLVAMSETFKRATDDDFCTRTISPGRRITPVCPSRVSIASSESGMTSSPSHSAFTSNISSGATMKGR